MKDDRGNTRVLSLEKQGQQSAELRRNPQKLEKLIHFQFAPYQTGKWIHDQFEAIVSQLLGMQVQMQPESSENDVRQIKDQVSPCGVPSLNFQTEFCKISPQVNSSAIAHNTFFQDHEHRPLPFLYTVEEMRQFKSDQLLPAPSHQIKNNILLPIGQGITSIVRDNQIRCQGKDKKQGVIYFIGKKEESLEVDGQNMVIQSTNHKNDKNHTCLNGNAELTTQWSEILDYTEDNYGYQKEKNMMNPLQKLLKIRMASVQLWKKEMRQPFNELIRSFFQFVNRPESTTQINDFSTMLFNEGITRQLHLNLHFQSQKQLEDFQQLISTLTSQKIKVEIVNSIKEHFSSDYLSLEFNQILQFQLQLLELYDYRDLVEHIKISPELIYYLPVEKSFIYNYQNHQQQYKNIQKMINPDKKQCPDLLDYFIHYAVLNFSNNKGLSSMLGLWSDGTIDSLYKKLKSSQISQLKKSKEYLHFNAFNTYYLQLYGQLYQLIYPGIRKTVDKMTKCLNQASLKEIGRKIQKTKKPQLQSVEEGIVSWMKKFRKQNNLSQGIIDTLISTLYKKERRQMLQNKTFIISLKFDQDKYYSLECFFQKCAQFFILTSGYQDLITKIIYHFKLEKYFNKQINNFEMPLHSMERQPLPCHECPACTQFYYQGINIRDDSINRVPILAISNQLPEQQQFRQLTQSIVALLNSSGGIIPLFCKIQYLSILPIGKIMKEDDKEQLLNKIIELTKDIEPQPEIDKEIQITFVPVKKSAIQEPHQHTRQYLRGQYVPRIKVAPRSKFYCSTFEGKKYYKFQNYQKVKIQDHQLRSFILSKRPPMMEMTPPNITKDEKISLQPLMNYYEGHICQEPQDGIPILTKQSRKRYSKKLVMLESQYDNLALIVGLRVNFSQIQNYLRKHGFQCILKAVYRNMDFNSTTFTAALYHNMTNQQLLQNITYNKDLQFQGRNTIAIPITPFLKVTEPIQDVTSQWFSNVSGWLHSQFPDQIIRMWKYQSPLNQIQCFLQTASKTSLLFIYYVMMHFESKGLFKDPEQLQSLIGLSQRNQRWKLRFSSYLQQPNSQNTFLKQVGLLQQNIKRKTYNSSQLYYIFHKLRQLFKQFKETLQINQDEQLTLQCFDMLRNRQIISFRSYLIQSMKLRAEKADALIEEIIVSPDIQQYFGWEQLFKYLMERIIQFIKYTGKTQNQGQAQMEFKKIINKSRCETAGQLIEKIRICCLKSQEFQLKEGSPEKLETFFKKYMSKAQDIKSQMAKYRFISYFSDVLLLFPGKMLLDLPQNSIIYSLVKYYFEVMSMYGSEEERILKNKVSFCKIFNNVTQWIKNSVVPFVDILDEKQAAYLQRILSTQPNLQPKDKILYEIINNVNHSMESMQKLIYQNHYKQSNKNNKETSDESGNVKSEQISEETCDESGNVKHEQSLQIIDTDNYLIMLLGEEDRLILRGFRSYCLVGPQNKQISYEGNFKKKKIGGEPFQNYLLQKTHIIKNFCNQIQNGLSAQNIQMADYFYIDLIRTVKKSRKIQKILNKSHLLAAARQKCQCDQSSMNIVQAKVEVFHTNPTVIE